MTLTDKQLVVFNKNFKEVMHMISLFFSKNIDKDTKIIDIKLEKNEDLTKIEWNLLVAYTVAKEKEKI